MRLCFPVPPEMNGALLRAFLCYHCALSTELTRAIKYRGDGFYADGRSVHTTEVLQTGQIISFSLPPERTDPVAAQPEIPLQICREDDFAAVIEKPAGIAVHPTLNYPEGTLANAWAGKAAAAGRTAVFRPVNRLDKNTSGLLLAAQNMYAAPLLSGQHPQPYLAQAGWQKPRKLYFAVVEGEMPLGPGVFDAPIGRSEGTIIGRCVTPEGKPSCTEYTVLQVKNGLSFVSCHPVTGRTHQIRVHFSHAGHPLAGDTLYGGHTDKIARHALHCAEISFSVPEYRRDGDSLRIAMPLHFHTVTVKSELPPDMCIL